MAEPNQAVTRRPRARALILAAVAATLVTVGVVALLVNIFMRKQEGRNPFYRVVYLTDDTEDPAIWGKNFPQQYDGYRRTVDQQRTATAAAKRCLARRPASIRGRSSPSHGSKRIRG